MKQKLKKKVEPEGSLSRCPADLAKQTKKAGFGHSGLAVVRRI